MVHEPVVRALRWRSIAAAKSESALDRLPSLTAWRSRLEEIGEAIVRCATGDELLLLTGA